jgi:hypothetical protein
MSFGAFDDVLNAGDEEVEDYQEEIKFEKEKAAKERNPSGLPLCRYSPNCFRTNPDHFKQFYHPERPSPLPSQSNHSPSNSPSKPSASSSTHIKPSYPHPDSAESSPSSSPPSIDSSWLTSYSPVKLGKNDSWLFPQQPCPQLMNGYYCRYSNIRFSGECKNAHPSSMLNPLKLTASFILTEPNVAKLADIKSEFERTKGGTFVGAKRITNKALKTAFEHRQQYITEKRGGSTLQDHLYHGCNETTINTICTTGFIVPADYQASPNCPVSKHVAHTTSLCNVDCTHCTQQHKWNKCHMFGLGIYLANQANKSNLYVIGTPAGQNKKMLLCKVELGNSFLHQKISTQDGEHNNVLPQQGYDSITVRADPQSQVGNTNKLSVTLDEYVVFHPFQVLPEYIIEYK